MLFLCNILLFICYLPPFQRILFLVMISFTFVQGRRSDQRRYQCQVLKCSGRDHNNLPHQIRYWYSKNNTSLRVLSMERISSLIFASVASGILSFIRIIRQYGDAWTKICRPPSNSLRIVLAFLRQSHSCLSRRFRGSPLSVLQTGSR